MPKLPATDKVKVTWDVRYQCWKTKHKGKVYLISGKPNAWAAFLNDLPTTSLEKGKKYTVGQLELGGLNFKEMKQPACSCLCL